MKLYGQEDRMGYAGSSVESLFVFFNQLVAETPDMHCESTRDCNHSRVNCHVCCYALAGVMSEPDIVAVTGAFANAAAHSWLEIRVFEAVSRRPHRIAVLDVFPVNSPHPILWLGGAVGPASPIDFYGEVLDKLYRPVPAKVYETDATLGSQFFKEDVGRLALAFGETQRRLGLTMP